MAADGIPTGIASSPDCTAHLTGPGHPEQPARVTAIVDRLSTGDTPLSKASLVTTLEGGYNLAGLAAAAASHARALLGGT